LLPLFGSTPNSIALETVGLEQHSFFEAAKRHVDLSFGNLPAEAP
jgi:hypothetical protein